MPFEEARLATLRRRLPSSRSNEASNTGTHAYIVSSTNAPELILHGAEGAEPTRLGVTRALPLSAMTPTPN